ncbi:hypothetical protein JTB14_026803 [Gonioctena quinquepunctata]|nr:hypothetical protein JTB14_026803 [Gonioctena quinquepunctata]
MEHRSSRSPLCRKTKFRKLYKHKLSVIEITKRGDRHQNTDIGERERETAGVVGEKVGEGVIQEHGPLRSRLERMRVSKDVGERRKKNIVEGRQENRRKRRRVETGNECRSSRCRKDHESRSDDDDSPQKIVIAYYDRVRRDYIL